MKKEMKKTTYRTDYIDEADPNRESSLKVVRDVRDCFWCYEGLNKEKKSNKQAMLDFFFSFLHQKRRDEGSHPQSLWGAIHAPLLCHSPSFFPTLRWASYNILNFKSWSLARGLRSTTLLFFCYIFLMRLNVLFYIISFNDTNSGIELYCKESFKWWNGK